MLVYGNSQCISQMFLESMQILGQSWSQCLQNLIKLLLSICRIPDAFGRDIEKACQSIYPLHDVFIRKVKVLKKPKFDRKFALYYFTRFINPLLTICHIILMMFREFGIGSTNPMIDILLYSHHLPAWYCIDIVRRNSVLITCGSERVKIVWCVLVFNTASIKTWVTKTRDNVKGFLTCTTSPLAWSHNKWKEKATGLIWW